MGSDASGMKISVVAKIDTTHKNELHPMVRKPISAYANHESHGPNPADIGIEDHSSAQDHNDVADQKATKRDADIDIGFRPFTDISVQKNK
ncbi:MAG: hypothetical protein Q3X74_02825 [Bifidobacterium sp.]|uniref:hypothetical protein n=1 Tax=Bifidobacterium sp. TaxID=41200 RepID=UPI00284EB476|nr:hypothetical protein [Bifidobacterium sp.]MDR3912093.1 hypothetical protein [Bifidobacterium sp.]